MSQHWEKLRFDDIAILQRGHDLPAHLQIPGEYPVVTSSGISGTHHEFIAKGPGVLTGRSGSVGRVHYIEQDYWPHNTTLYVIDFKGNLPRYVYYLLQFINPAKVANSTGVPTLDRNNVHKLVVDHPPLAEQKRIVAILDEKLAAVERARAAAQAQLQAAQALPAAYLRAVFESEEAQEWPRYELDKACSIVAKQVDPTVPDYSVLPHVNGENIESGTLRLKNVKTAAEDGMTSGKYLFEAGDVLYSKLRPYLRKVALVDFDGLCSADMYPLKANAEVIDARFLAWSLLSEEFTAYAIDESERSRMPKLNRQQLFSWVAPVPSLNRQQAIAQLLQEKMTGIEELVKSLQAQLETINQLPATLLNQAFTGEL